MILLQIIRNLLDRLNRRLLGLHVSVNQCLCLIKKIINESNIKHFKNLLQVFVGLLLIFLAFFVVLRIILLSKRLYDIYILDIIWNKYIYIYLGPYIHECLLMLKFYVPSTYLPYKTTLYWLEIQHNNLLAMYDNHIFVIGNGSQKGAFLNQEYLTKTDLNCIHDVLLVHLRLSYFLEHPEELQHNLRLYLRFFGETEQYKYYYNCLLLFVKK